MIVIVDIDDVIMPWAAQVHQACLDAGLNPEGKTWTQWNMWEDYGCNKDQWVEVVGSLAVAGGLYHSQPYPGAVEALWRLHDAGHEIHLVTARGFHNNALQIREWTHEWVYDNNIPGKLTFAEDKGEVAKKIGATHAIDDRVENAEAMQKAGVDVYLVSQPHNFSRYWNEARRVDSLSEFVDRILAEDATKVMKEIRSVSKTGGEKGVKPQRYSLMPRAALERISEVYHFGTEKYSAHNWRLGYEWSKSYDAVQRHLNAWWDREETDPESGLSHLSHAGFHIFALLVFSGNPRYKQFDDRYQEPEE